MFTARKRSLGQGNIFTPVCHSIHGGGVPGPGGCAWWRPPGAATAAGGTHPSGMHSCFNELIGPPLTPRTQLIH